MTQFKGKLFGGRLFAGRLFRAPVVQDRPDVIPYGSGRTIHPQKTARKRRDTDDDVLLFLLR